jgi:hypothetical protein
LMVFVATIPVPPIPMTPMSKQKKLHQKLIPWLEAKKRHRLSDMHIQMARELGMNPKKLGKLANHKQEPWKLPLPQFIEKCYLKSFKRARPEKIISLIGTPRATASNPGQDGDGGTAGRNGPAQTSPDVMAGRPEREAGSDDVPF